MSAPFTVTAHGPNSHTITIPFKRSTGYTVEVLVTSDRHWDHPDSDQEMQRRHLDRAREIGAPVIDLGDFLCLMQGRGDKRGSKGKVRPEHIGDNYFDRVMDTATDFLEPYVPNLAILADGNHTTSILKHHEFDPMHRLVTSLRARTGVEVQRGGYSGFIRFVLDDGGAKFSKIAYYHHGAHGGVVTRGVIGTARRAAYIDADIILTGHIHEEWRVTTERLRMRQDGTVRQDEVLHVQVPSYKQDYKTGQGGWAVERGMTPRSIGAAWLRFEWIPSGPIRSKTGRVVVDSLRAR